MSIQGISFELINSLLFIGSRAGPPHSAPPSNPGKINVPSNIVHTVKFISILKETTDKDVEKFTTNNFQQLFKINIG